jgi:hypothetical protein
MKELEAESIKPKVFWKTPRKELKAESIKPKAFLKIPTFTHVLDGFLL